jgi:glutamate formiminotransferase/formiminotetrahydrofolate cyclodeaminase
MVARITARAERFAAVRSEADALADAADVLRERFSAAREVDEEAYGAVVAASALPKSTDDEKRHRTIALQAALIRAAEAPLAVAGMTAEGAALVRRAGALGNTHLVSDVECAAAFLHAALTASAANVRINHRFIKDATIVSEQDARLARILIEAQRDLSP